MSTSLAAKSLRTEENVQNIEDIQSSNEGIKPSEENDFTGEK